MSTKEEIEKFIGQCLNTRLFHRKENVTPDKKTIDKWVNGLIDLPADRLPDILVEFQGRKVWPKQFPTTIWNIYRAINPVIEPSPEPKPWYRRLKEWWAEVRKEIE